MTSNADSLSKGESLFGFDVLRCVRRAEGSNFVGNDARGFITLDGFRSPLIIPKGRRDVIFDGLESSFSCSSVGDTRTGCFAKLAELESAGPTAAGSPLF